MAPVASPGPSASKGTLRTCPAGTGGPDAASFVSHKPCLHSGSQLICPSKKPGWAGQLPSPHTGCAHSNTELYLGCTHSQLHRDVETSPEYGAAHKGPCPEEDDRGLSGCGSGLRGGTGSPRWTSLLLAVPDGGRHHRTLGRARRAARCWSSIGLTWAWPDPLPPQAKPCPPAAAAK